MEPYEYQKQVEHLFLQGEDLIIQAPTGSGKTIAALKPGLIGLDKGLQRQAAHYPQRIVYGIPMRVLANGFKDTFTNTALEMGWEQQWYPRIQTGEHPDDPLFEGQLIFATVDQVLASFLNIPYGLPGKLDNINAGAMIGSYLIFDEFHLYPRDQMMLTVLAMLTMLKDVSRFMLMSATFSPVFLKKIADQLGAKALYDEPGTLSDDSWFKDVKSLNKTRVFVAHDDAHLDVKAVRTHRRNRTLVICNTVDRAQALYRDLVTEYQNTDVEVRLLHSRFYRHDRTAIEDWVRERFDAPNAEYDGPPTILVATQVIEVGLDITSDVLLTECAPAASLIQRAGRCARKSGESGEVHVYQPFDAEDNVNYAPYIDDGQEDICHKTWRALSSDTFNGQEMSFAKEQQLVEAAHSKADAELVAGLDQAIETRIDEITACMRTRDAGAASNLIRKQSTAQFYIHDNPLQDDTLTTTPWRYEGFGLSRGRIAHAFEDIEERGTDAAFIFTGGKEDSDNDPETPFTRTVYNWHPLRTPQEAYSYWRFVAHPDAVYYDNEIGLQLIPGDRPATLSPKTAIRPWENFAYQSERYHEHIDGLFHAYIRPMTGRNPPYIRLKDELAYPLRHLCHKFGKDEEHGEMLMRLIIALHDVGKLNHRWQTWARAWQQAYAQQLGQPEVPLGDEHPLAHTDYDSGNEKHRTLQKEINKKTKRGPHAVESAEACLPIIWEASGEDQFWMAVCTAAIMRHHTPDAEQCNAFYPVSEASQSIEQALVCCGFTRDEAARWSVMIQSFDASSGSQGFAKSIAPNKNSYGMTLMYYLLVRILRLADQRSIVWWQRLKEMSKDGNR